MRFCCRCLAMCTCSPKTCKQQQVEQFWSQKAKLLNISTVNGLKKCSIYATLYIIILNTNSSFGEICKKIVELPKKFYVKSLI